jgi:hypothetical protein
MISSFFHLEMPHLITEIHPHNIYNRYDWNDFNPNECFSFLSFNFE